MEPKQIRMVQIAVSNALNSDEMQEVTLGLDKDGIVYFYRWSDSAEKNLNDDKPKYKEGWYPLKMFSYSK